MNPTTLSAVWLHVLALLAIEAGVIALVTAATARICASAGWRRNVYQAGVLAMLIVTLCELSGWGREVAGCVVGGLAGPLKSVERLHARINDGSAKQSGTAVFQGQKRESSTLDLPLALRSGAHSATPPAVDIGRKVQNGSPSFESMPVHREPSISVVAPVARQSREKSYGAPEASDAMGGLWLWLIWVIGAALVAGRAFIGRCLFLLFRSRRRAVTEAQLLEKVSRLSRRLGLRRPVRVVESARLKGPIAFGLTHPTIGLPLGFSTQFDDNSQSVILAHELAHLAAHDALWHTLADLAAALIWWHPAVWWTRRQLRITSELAADDACLLVADGPGILAKCLLELGARLTQTPLMGGLSVSGFRSHLGRRIQRLLGMEAEEWAPPGRARAAVLRLFGPLALVAVIVLASAWMEPQALTKGSNMKTIQLNWKRSLATFALLGAVNGPEVTPATAQPHQVSAPISQATASPNRLDTPRRAAIETKLQDIVLDQLAIDGLPLSEVIRHLSEAATRKDPKKEGINFLFDPNAPPTSVPPSTTIDPTTGLPVASTPAEQIDISSITIKFNLPLRNVTMKAALDAIMRVADHPIHYAVEDYGVVVSGGTGNSVTQPNMGPTSPATASPKRPDSAKRASIEAKLQEIVLPELGIDGLPLSEVIRHLSEEATKKDPKKEGINFLFDPNTPSISASPSTTIDPATGLPVPSAPIEQIDISSITIKFNLPLRNVTMKEALDAIMRVADHPIHYTVEDFGVLISLGPDLGQTVAEAPSAELASQVIDLMESGQAADLASLLEERKAVERQLSDMKRQGFLESHPLMMRSRERLSELGDQITNRINSLMAIKESGEASKSQPFTRGASTASTSSSGTLDRLESLQVEQDALLAREVILLNQLKRLKTNDFNKLIETIPTAMQDDLLTSLLEQRTIADQKLISAEKEFGPEHAEVIKAKSSLFDLSDKITNRVNGILFGLQAKVDSQKAYVDELKAKIKSVGGAAAKLYEEARWGKLGETTSAPSLQIVTRAYKMDTNTLASGMHHAFNLNLEHMSGGTQASEFKIQSAFVDLFGRFGINLSAPDRLFYNDVSGVLLVRATAEEQESIAAVIQTLGGHQADSATSAGGLSLIGSEPRAGNP